MHAVFTHHLVLYGRTSVVVVSVFLILTIGLIHHIGQSNLSLEFNNTKDSGFMLHDFLIIN